MTQWVLFANSTLATGLFVAESSEKETPRLLSGLNKILENNSYITGENFTVSDVAIGSILSYASMMLQMSYADYPAIDAYMKRISDRPVTKKQF